MPFPAHGAAAIFVRFAAKAFLIAAAKHLSVAFPLPIAAWRGTVHCIVICSASDVCIGEYSWVVRWSEAFSASAEHPKVVPCCPLAHRAPHQIFVNGDNNLPTGVAHQSFLVLGSRPLHREILDDDAGD